MSACAPADGTGRFSLFIGRHSDPEQQVCVAAPPLTSASIEALLSFATAPHPGITHANPDWMVDRLDLRCYGLVARGQDWTDQRRGRERADGCRGVICRLSLVRSKSALAVRAHECSGAFTLRRNLSPR